MKHFILGILAGHSMVLAETNCDFGDFPTTGFGPGGTNGYDQTANHPILSSLYLGAAAPDAESAATPNASATGDDASGSDENVSDFPIVTNFDVPGDPTVVQNIITIPVTNSTGAIANVWAFIDFDRDGVLGELGETFGPFAFSSIPNGQAQPFQLTLTLSKSRYVEGEPLLMPVRFRIGNDSNLGPTGPALNGEVEDHFLNLGTLPPTPDGGNNGVDYGDLPDSGFGPNGVGYDQTANHVATNDLFLGTAAGDGETGAQPNASATGDDGGDENLSEFTTETTFDANNTATILIRFPYSNQISAPANVSFFADLNLNGSFADPGEVGVFNNIPVTQNGILTLQFQLTAGLFPPGGPYIVPFRFRISSQTGLGPGGAAPDGEVEDHLLDFGSLPVPTGPQIDFGDFPDRLAGTGSGEFGTGDDSDVPDYRTLAADDGPRHTIVPGLAILSDIGFLPAVDAEDDGQPTADARGDDNDGSPDEEIAGLQLSNINWSFVTTSPQVARYSATASIDVPIINTTGDDAFLKAWVDLDFDGDFTLNELIADGSTPVAAGTSTVTVSFPFNFDFPDRCFLRNETFYFPIRYRLTSDSAIGPHGPSTGTPPLGEVVDELHQLNGINTIDLCRDYGDFPSVIAGSAPGVFGTSNPPDYRVFLSEEGPVHNPSDDLAFASDASGLADGEADGLASADATGDAGDEDELLVRVTRLETTVLSTNPPSFSTVVELEGSLPVINTLGQDAFVRLWMDDDFDGLFENTEELPVIGGRLVSSTTAPDTGRTITFTMSRTILSSTCALDEMAYFPVRARISRNENVPPFGNGGPGEVEDHLVVIPLLSPDLCALGELQYDSLSAFPGSALLGVPLTLSTEDFIPEAYQAMYSTPIWYLDRTPLSGNTLTPAQLEEVQNGARLWVAPGEGVPGIAPQIPILDSPALVAALMDAGIPVSEQLPHLDPDGDLIPNFVEFALGSNPNNGADAPALLAQVNEEVIGQTEFAGLPYLRRTGGTMINGAYLADGIAYEVEASFDLESWDVMTVETMSVPDDLPPPPANYEWAFGRITQPFSTIEKTFFRLLVRGN